MQDEILHWQASIKLTQAPHPFEPDGKLDEQDLPYSEPTHLRSFLYDPFGEMGIETYGIELSSSEKIDVTFFTKAKTELEAIELGNAWLTNLKFNFLGLDGYVEAIPIREKDFIELKANNLLEIKLPGGVLKNKVNIIERFVSSFYIFRVNKAKLYFLWQEVPKKKDIGKHQMSTYILRVFIKYENDNSNSKELKEFMGVMRFLCMELENTYLERAELVEPKNIILRDILEGNVFNNGSFETFTKYEINFDFPENLPLPKLPILDYENVRYIDLNEEFKKNAIGMGWHINNAIITRHTTFTPINKLPQDIAIFGKSGSGKTYFLAKFIQELSKKAKYRGILVLNVAKESQEIYYKNFSVIKYSDDNFNIPYYTTSGDLKSKEKFLQQTATYICASLGLKNVFEKIIYRIMIGFLDLEKQLPTYFYHLLKGVENYMNHNPYGPEEQSNLMQAFRNRMYVFDDNRVKTVLKLSNDLPSWLNSWLNGGKIFLDLSHCSKFVKLLVVNAIFQAIRTLTKDIEAETLKHLIVIDEAHAILEKPITTNSDDADFIMKEQMAKIFSELLKEYRSRGVGFIIVDQSPSRLFDEVVSQPSIKVIFSQDHPDNLLFSEDPKERQMLTQLENRLALVINGATGEKYLMKTKDYKYN